MSEGELNAVFRGLARDAAAAGKNMADSVAKAADKTAQVEEKNVAAILAADAKAAERIEAAAKKTTGSSRASWPVVEGVTGTAKGKVLRAPNPRHTISGAKTGEVKADNTITLRGYEHVLSEDTAKIAANKAEFVPESDLYNVAGRTYRVKGNGAVFPVSGPGLVQLSRSEYAALQKIAKANGDVSKVREFKHDPTFIGNPAVIAKAKSIYDGTYQP